MPTHNEEKNIEVTISSWIPIIENHPGSEILIIDGNSTDNTRLIINKLSRKYKFVKLIHKTREGYGKDLMHGYKNAIASKHEWIFQTDSDGHFEAKDFYKLWKKRKSSSLIIGRRFKRKDVKIRILLASLIELWIQVLFNRRIKDSNIPFRLIRRSFLKRSLNRIPPSTIAPNIFLTIIASRQGHNLHHIPVTHKSIKNGNNNSRLFKGALKGFVELLLFAIFKI